MLVGQLLPAARQGLVEAGVAAEEAEALLAVIEAWTASGQTGAAWQRQALAALEGSGEPQGGAPVGRGQPRLGRGPALVAMLERYLELQAGGDPVHTWPLPAAGPG